MALIEANLQLNVEKTVLFAKEVQVLGHRVGGGNIRPGLDKTVSIREFPTPNTKRKVRSFLGLTSYFRKFVQNYAQIAKPLTLLTKDDTKFYWGPEQEAAFNELKSRLIEGPILKAPDFS